MRLVIPYRYRENSEELRYAIRSMVKHFIPLSGVLLIGDKPEWYCGDHIPMADIMNEDNTKINKELSMQLKIMAVPDEAFLYSNDDFFANQDFKITPYYYFKTCGEMARDVSSATYRELYGNCLQDWNNYDLHVPMIMMRDKFHRTFNDMIDQGIQTPIKTTYAYDCIGTFMQDIKIRGPHTREELEWLIKDRPFFSTHDSAVDETLIEFLQDKFPVPSPHEL